MFNNLHSMPRTDAEVATQALHDEGIYRFPMFSAGEAVTLGLSIRKRFRASSRHSKGKGLVVSVQSIAGHTLFACTVGDLGHPIGISDVSLDSWSILDNMVDVVKRTGHSSFYVEKGMGALGKSAKQLGLGEGVRVCGGAFPIWLDNAPLCPIAIAACYSGSSQDDHNLVVTTVRDFLNKMKRQPETPVQSSSRIPTIPAKAHTESEYEQGQSEYTHEHELEHDQETEHEQEHELELEHEHHEREPSYRAESVSSFTETEVRSIRSAASGRSGRSNRTGRSER